MKPFMMNILTFGLCSWFKQKYCGSQVHHNLQIACLGLYLAQFWNQFISQQPKMSQYAVEAIIDRRLSKKNQNEYLVKWVGFSVEESTWEPLKNLKYVMEMVELYDKEQEKKKENNENSNASSRPISILGLERKPTDKSSRNLRNSSRTTPKMSEQSQISNKKVSSDEKDEESEDQKPRKIMKKQEKMEFKSRQTDSKSKKTTTKRLSKSKLSPKEMKSIKCKLENHEKNRESNHNKEVSPQKLLSDEENVEDEDFFDKHGKDTAPSVGNSNEEKLTILGMCRGCNDQFLYYVESSNRLRSYKTRSYMVDNYAESLISFYEGKIVFSEPPQAS